MEALLADMTPADLDEVVPIADRSFRPPWTRAAFAAELERPVARCRVARTEPGGPVRAYAVWWIVGGELSLLSIASDPAARRRGLARALFADMLAEADRAGVRDAFLEVRPSNTPAVALYRAHGFELLDRRPRYYDDGEDAWIMARQAT